MAPFVSLKSGVSWYAKLESGITKCFRVTAWIILLDPLRPMVWSLKQTVDLKGWLEMPFYFMNYIKHIRMCYYAGCSNQQNPKALRACLDRWKDREKDFLKNLYWLMCRWLFNSFSSVSFKGKQDVRIHCPSAIVFGLFRNQLCIWLIV